MILVDANLLLYAYHVRAEQHAASRAWLEAALSGPELVRFARHSDSRARDDLEDLTADVVDDVVLAARVLAE